MPFLQYLQFKEENNREGYIEKTSKRKKGTYPYSSIMY